MYPPNFAQKFGTKYFDSFQSKIRGRIELGDEDLEHFIQTRDELELYFETREHVDLKLYFDFHSSTEEIEGIKKVANSLICENVEKFKDIFSFLELFRERYFVGVLSKYQYWWWYLDQHFDEIRRIRKPPVHMLGR